MTSPIATAVRLSQLKIWVNQVKKALRFLEDLTNLISEVVIWLFSDFILLIFISMEQQTVLILVAIGIVAGILSGFVGVGGGVVIVPALVYILGMSQHAAQGTSLFVLLLPTGILAVQNYWKSGNVDWKFGLIVALTFVLGGYIGSKIALKLSPSVVKLVFGAVMAYVSIRMILSGFNGLGNEQ